MNGPRNQRTHDLIYSAVPAGVWLISESSMVFGSASETHSHDATQILMMIEGEMTLCLPDGDRSLPLPQRMAVAIPPGVRHRVERSTTRRVKFLDLRLDLERFPPLDVTLRRQRAPLHALTAEEDVAAIRGALAQAASSREPLRTMQTIALIWKVACTLVQRSAADSNASSATTYAPHVHDARIVIVDSYIREHLDQDLSLPRLAAAARLSPSQLTRHFNAVLGMTPARYVETRRIEQALELLATGTYSVKEVAGLCGYRGLPQFHRAFKRLTGRTPRQIMQETLPAEHGLHSGPG